MQHWPELVHGAGRDRIWAPERFDTCGQRAYVPPDGLHWQHTAEPDLPHLDVGDLCRRSPATSGGLTIDADAITLDPAWDYSYGDGIRARLIIPWHSGQTEKGKVHLDFAYDERLPEPPVLTRITRTTGPSLGLWTASRELSLAWKLQWLGTDQSAEGMSAGKDLYDAVLLAELPGLALSRRLRRHVLTSTDPAIFRPDRIRTWRIDRDSLPNGAPVNSRGALVNPCGAPASPRGAPANSSGAPAIPGDLSADPAGPGGDPVELLARLASAMPDLLGGPDADGDWPAYRRW